MIEEPGSPSQRQRHLPQPWRHHLPQAWRRLPLGWRLVAVSMSAYGLGLGGLWALLALLPRALGVGALPAGALISSGVSGLSGGLALGAVIGLWLALWHVLYSTRIGAVPMERAGR